MSENKTKMKNASICEIFLILWERFFLHTIVENTISKNAYFGNGGKLLFLQVLNLFDNENIETIKQCFSCNKRCISSDSSLYDIKQIMKATPECSFFYERRMGDWLLQKSPISYLNDGKDITKPTEIERYNPKTNSCQIGQKYGTRGVSVW